LFAEDLGWGLPLEDFAGPVVQRERDRLEVFGGPSRQVSALGEVLAQEPVGVLVRRPLPRRVRVGEEHSRASIESELGVRGQLLAAVPGQSLPSCSGSFVIDAVSAAFIATAP
jgi:hypothetical protein